MVTTIHIIIPTALIIIGLIIIIFGIITPDHVCPDGYSLYSDNRLCFRVDILTVLLKYFTVIAVFSRFLQGAQLYFVLFTIYCNIIL